MDLIIAEKPSLAKAYVTALGGSVGTSNPREGYWTVGDKLVTFAFGHLFEVCQPSEHDPKWEKWTLDVLPMIPAQFKYKASSSSIEQWKIIKGLIGRPDVKTIINGCDAGREGELIFRLIYDNAHTNKPSKRIWVSSLTPQAIQAAFKALKDSSEYDALAASAYARQAADWLIGMNATRCQTVVARSLGSNETFSLGRVQTPVLTLIVKRDLLIENFKSALFYGITATFRNQNNLSFNAALIDEEKKLKLFENKSEAETLNKILTGIKSAPVIELFETKKVSVKQPLLFDLTALQREMNKKEGWTAAKTLEVMQGIYEKKLVTYPRTDSSFLTEDDNEVIVPEILKSFENLEGNLIHQRFGNFINHAKKIKTNNWKLTERHVDNSKVTDHHAIVPTGTQPDRSTSAEELNLYQVIAERFLAAFYPAGIDEKTELIVRVENHRFIARGKKIIEAGWREIFQSSEEIDQKDVDDTESQGSDGSEIQEQKLLIEKSDRLTKDAVIVHEKKTKPPGRYNDATILAVMQTAGRNIEDDEARDAMKELGIGRPATRGEIIEKLVKIGYVERKKKALISTGKGRKVIDMLGDNLLTSAELTGKWEAALNRIEAKTLDPARFSEGVKMLTAETVDFIKKQLERGARFDPDNIGDCPKCVVAGRKGKLKEMTAQNKVKYLVCTTGKENCGFICNHPKKKALITKLLSSKCPKCTGIMLFRNTKNDIPYLTCEKGREKCDGVIWLENKPKPKAKAS